MFTGGCGAGWKNVSWELSPDPEKNICRSPICGILALEAANQLGCAAPAMALAAPMRAALNVSRDHRHRGVTRYSYLYL
jgi:hypothetical protein